jgi:hypothetical protein
VESHDLVVVEDDIFADFETEPAPRLAALDGLDRVVRIGSFSKTLSASFRCGYIAARPDWIEKLTDIRIATGFASNRLSEELVLAVLGSGGYRKHMEALRARLAGAMAGTILRLRALGIEPWIEPGPACSPGAVCRTASMPPPWPAAPSPTASSLPPVTSSAPRNRQRASCASTWRSAGMSGCLGCLRKR